MSVPTDYSKKSPDQEQCSISNESSTS